MSGVPNGVWLPSGGSLLVCSSSLFSMEYRAHQSSKHQAPENLQISSSKPKPEGFGGHPGRRVELWGLELLLRAWRLGFEASQPSHSPKTARNLVCDNRQPRLYLSQIAQFGCARDRLKVLVETFWSSPLEEFTVAVGEGKIGALTMAVCGKISPGFRGRSRNQKSRVVNARFMFIDESEHGRRGFQFAEVLNVIRSFSA